MSPCRSLRNRRSCRYQAQKLGYEWLEFFDIARTDAGRIPEEILANKDIVAQLPLVFRTLKGQKLTGEQLEKLAHELEKLNDGE